MTISNQVQYQPRFSAAPQSGKTAPKFGLLDGGVSCTGCGAIGCGGCAIVAEGCARAVGCGLSPLKIFMRIFRNIPGVKQVLTGIESLAQHLPGRGEKA